MKRKKFSTIFIREIFFLGFFILFFIFTSNVSAESYITSSQQLNIANSLKTQSEITLLNTLNNADVISKLSVPNIDPVKKNSITLPVLKIPKMNLSLLGSGILSIGADITSDYNNFILQPVSDVETATFLMIGDGLISLGNATDSIYNNYVYLPKIALPKTDAMASVIKSNISFSTNSILKKISHLFSFIENKMSAFFKNITNEVKNILTGTVTTRNELCINTTCVTEDQLKTLLKDAQTSQNPNPVPSASSN